MSRILLVDDDEPVRRAYTQILGRAGHTIDAVEDGEKALAKVAANHYDVIVSDLAMPGLDGVGFLKAVRAHDLDVPVLLVTGTPALDTAMDAVELGAFRYLVKPVQPEILTEVVGRAAQLHQMALLKRDALAVVGDQGAALGDRASLEARFDAAMAGMRMAFQPIVSMRRKQVIGYEALLRTDEKTLARPDHFIGAAERLGRVLALGRRARIVTGEAAAATPPDIRIFVNLHAHDLNDDELVNPATPLFPMASRVIFEITERASLDGIRDPRGCAVRLRANGFRMAVDDLGAGYAGLTTLAQMEPEVVKLDMSLVRNLHESQAKQSIVRSMIKLCDEMKVECVAEGVETVVERDCLFGMGCDLVQGFFFARPTFAFDHPAASLYP